MSATFHEVELPREWSYRSKGGPGFSTLVNTSTGGKEKRNINWSSDRGQWDISYDVRTLEEYNDGLLPFFRNRWGKAYGFRLYDWFDYSFVAMPCGGSPGNGTRTQFQLQKIYTDTGSYNYTRKITKPIAGTVHVYDNGVEIPKDTGSPHFTVDLTTGIVTISTAPLSDHIITADAEFCVPVRFDIDQLSVTYADFDNLEWSCPIVELRDEL